MSDLKENFLKKVKEYGCKNEDLAVNYFIKLDEQLKVTLPVKTWHQISFDDFLQKSIAYANIGIDPLAKKMLSFLLYANKATGKSDVVFVEDVHCMEILARRYGINCPENITVELVYSTDAFTLKKKSLTNPVEGYELDVTEPFNRGDIIGGVSLTEFSNPIYNKVRMMSISEIEKRVRTKGANGKETTFWANYKPEMCEKTIAKNAWGKVVLDTTELSEYYALSREEPEFEPENKEELPFNPEDEV